MQSISATNIEYYQIITGYITELEIYDTHESYIQARKLAGYPDINLKLIGHLDLVFMENSIITNYSSMNKSDCPTSDVEQYVRFKLGDKVIEGTFCGVAFSEGNYVEVVVDQIEGGTYFAYALRQPAEHLLWLHPYATTGTEAHLNRLSPPKPLRLKALGGIGILIGILGVVQAFTQESFVPLLLVFLGLMCLLPLRIFSNIQKEVNSGSTIANRIFATLGYANPKRFDITEEEKLFINKLTCLSLRYLESYEGPLTNSEDIIQEFIEKYKNQQSPEDTENDKLLKQFMRLQKDGMQWFYLYRSAPTIPNYITVIHTENNQEKRIGN